MLRKFLGFVFSAGAFVSWFCRETFKSWVFDRVIKMIDPVQVPSATYVVEYGPPILFATLVLVLILQPRFGWSNKHMLSISLMIIGSVMFVSGLMLYRDEHGHIPFWSKEENKESLIEEKKEQPPAAQPTHSRFYSTAQKERIIDTLDTFENAIKDQRARLEGVKSFAESIPQSVWFAIPYPPSPITMGSDDQRKKERDDDLKRTDDMLASEIKNIDVVILEISNIINSTGSAYNNLKQNLDFYDFVHVSFDDEEYKRRGQNAQGMLRRCKDGLSTFRLLMQRKEFDIAQVADLTPCNTKFPDAIRSILSVLDELKDKIASERKQF